MAIAKREPTIQRVRLSALCLFFGALSPQVSAQDNPAPSPACPPLDVKVSPLSAGQTRLTATSVCRANEPLVIDYAGVEFVRKIGANGTLDFILDCFAGDSEPVQVKSVDGVATYVQVLARDLETVSKIAVIWHGPVNLDLHVMEYAADHGQPGHVWAGSPGSALDSMRQAQGDGRARGYMSTVGNGAISGENVEVYTLWNIKDQVGGAIATSLDYESRARIAQDPEACGQGLYADVEYEVVLWNQRRVTRSKGAYAPLPCGQKVDSKGRYYSKAVPDIFFNEAKS